MDEDDEAPPGCEEAFSTTVRKAKFQFDSETKSTLIGTCIFYPIIINVFYISVIFVYK